VNCPDYFPLFGIIEPFELICIFITVIKKIYLKKGDLTLINDFNAVKPYIVELNVTVYTITNDFH